MNLTKPVKHFPLIRKITIISVLLKRCSLKNRPLLILCLTNYTSKFFLDARSKITFTLTYFSPMSHFYTPCKRQKTAGFLMFAGSIEM